MIERLKAASALVAGASCLSDHSAPEASAAGSVEVASDNCSCRHRTMVGAMARCKSRRCSRKKVRRLCIRRRHEEGQERRGRAAQARSQAWPAATYRGVDHAACRQTAFAWPGHDVKCSTDKIAVGLDIKGDGGYVLAPPSFVSDDDGAGSYTWSVDGASEFAKAPEWLFPSAEVAELDKRRPAEHWQRISRGVPEGSRNQHEASMFGHLLRKGVDPEVAINCMRGWNMLCTPPQDEESLLKTLKSILEAELKRRGRA